MKMGLLLPFDVVGCGNKRLFWNFRTLVPERILGTLLSVSSSPKALRLGSLFSPEGKGLVVDLKMALATRA